MRSDYQDADLMLRLYELRREPVMRASRRTLLREFWPRSGEDVIEVATNGDHALNDAYRQVSTYYELAFGMARRGMIDPDFLLENSTEGLLVFARVEPHLDALRAATWSRAFIHAEWMANQSDLGRLVMDSFRARTSLQLARRARRARSGAAEGPRVPPGTSPGGPSR